MFPVTLILDYYGNFRLRITAGFGISDRQGLDKGIITSCTISVILFTRAVNMIVRLAEVECRSPLTTSAVHQPPIQTFMDDLTVTTRSRWIFQRLENLVILARIRFKPPKSRWTHSASHWQEPPSLPSHRSQLRASGSSLIAY